MIEKIKGLWRRHRLLAAYVIAGVGATLVDIGLFRLLRFHMAFNENLANTVSTVVAIAFAYATNKLFVFKTHCASRSAFFSEMFSFFAARGLTLGIQVGGGFLLMTILGFEEMFSKCLLIVIVQILNFVFSKLLIFKKKDI